MAVDSRLSYENIFRAFLIVASNTGATKEVKAFMRDIDKSISAFHDMILADNIHGAVEKKMMKVI